MEEDGVRKMMPKLAHDRDGDVVGGGDSRWWQEDSDREGFSIEGVGRVFQIAVEPGRKLW